MLAERPPGAAAGLTSDAASSARSDGKSDARANRAMGLAADCRGAEIICKAGRDLTWKRIHCSSGLDNSRVLRATTNHLSRSLSHRADRIRRSQCPQASAPAAWAHVTPDIRDEIPVASLEIKHVELDAPSNVGLRDLTAIGDPRRSL
jgi:hypothetical protein